MDRIISKLKINFLIYILALVLLPLGVVKADSIKVTVSGDLATITYSGRYTANSLRFYYNTKNNYNTAVPILDTKMAIKTSNQGKISLKNNTYYFWAYNTLTGGAYASGAVKVTGSCTDQLKTGVTSTFQVQRCAIVSVKNNVRTITPSRANINSNNNFVECASGYKMQADNNGSPTTDTCKSLSMGAFNKRYCKQVYSGKCVKSSSSSGGSSGGSGSSSGSKPSVAAPSLSSLSVNAGSLSPSFKSGTKSYKVSVAANVSSINVSAKAKSGSSFVSGYGPRTVKLNYGSNTIAVKVKNKANKTVTYKIVVTRADDRSNVNTLSNLTVDKGTLSPAFTSGNTNYTVNVANNVSQITIGATLTDNKSTFANGFGPKTYDLQLGTNKIYVKVVSQKGATNVYNITVVRETTPSRCTTEINTLALLKEINLSSDREGVAIDQIMSFDSRVFTYDDIKVPFAVTDLIVNAYVNEEGDTVLVEGAENLEVGVPREVKITVTSKECTNFSNVYTLNVTRQAQVEEGTVADLSSLSIEDYDDIGFESNKYDYGITLHKGDTELKLNYATVDPKATCREEGNQDLTQGSVIKIICTSEDENDTVTYSLSIDGVEKGTNTFLIIIIIIIIVIILIYLILRLLGYRIYFNFAVIGAFFRGIGEKISGIFDK